MFFKTHYKDSCFCWLNPPTVIPRDISGAHGVVQQGLPNPVAAARRRPAVQQRPQRVSIAGRARHVARQGTVLRGVPGFSIRWGKSTGDHWVFHASHEIRLKFVGAELAVNLFSSRKSETKGSGDAMQLVFYAGTANHNIMYKWIGSPANGPPSWSLSLFGAQVLEILAVPGCSIRSLIRFHLTRSLRNLERMVCASKHDAICFAGKISIDSIGHFREIWSEGTDWGNKFY